MALLGFAVLVCLLNIQAEGTRGLPVLSTSADWDSDVIVNGSPNVAAVLLHLHFGVKIRTIQLQLALQPFNSSLFAFRTLCQQVMILSITIMINCLHVHIYSLHHNQ